MNRLGGVQRHGVMLKPDAAVISEVLRYVAEGRLHGSIEHEFPLQQALAAVERSRSGRVQGKIVLLTEKGRYPLKGDATLLKGSVPIFPAGQ
jgi:NADPH:quinone reductase-like Zn-dependent oxidoreductase